MMQHVTITRVVLVAVPPRSKLRLALGYFLVLNSYRYINKMCVF